MGSAAESLPPLVVGTSVVTMCPLPVLDVDNDPAPIARKWYDLLALAATRRVLRMSLFFFLLINFCHCKTTSHFSVDFLVDFSVDDYGVVVPVLAFW